MASTYTGKPCRVCGGDLRYLSNGHCVSCHRKRSAERGPAWQLKHRYGLQEEQYAAMLKAQEGKCAICGRACKLCVDHCHKTGAVRALLCDGCNRGIGYFKEDPARIVAAIAYLERHNGRAAPCHTTTP